jgi:hypothetical protein
MQVASWMHELTPSWSISIYSMLQARASQDMQTAKRLFAALSNLTSWS